MRSVGAYLTFGTVVLTMTLPNYSWAKSGLESRIERVEVMLENQQKVYEQNDLEEIKQQIQELRGVMEEHQHELQLLQNKQVALQKELNTRLTRDLNGVSSSPELEVSASANSATKAPATAKPNPGATNSMAINPSSPGASLSITPATSSVASTTTANTATAKPASEQAMYDAAYKLIEAKKYQEAQTAFQDFLWQYSDSKYVANVHYWLGEVYLAYWHEDKTNQLQIEKAISSFKTVASKYPQHNKAVDCLLKLGLTEVERENWSAAKEYFTTVVNKYPDSSRAKIASMRLETLQEQGLI